MDRLALDNDRRFACLVGGLVLAATLVLPAGCKAASKETTREAVREQSSEEALPTMDPTVSDPEAAAARERLRPEAELPGTVAIVMARTPTCLAIRVHERFLLTAASCVMEIFSTRPRAGYLYGITFDLAWQVKGEQRIASAVAAAVYPHPTFVDYFNTARQGKASLWTDTKALAQVADLALVEVSSKSDLTSLPIVTFSSALPAALQAKGSTRPELVALHGHCGAAAPPADADRAEGGGAAKPARPFLAGGRLLSATVKKGEWRGYLADRYPVPRALFDCESFLGAPVIDPKGGTSGQPVLLGLTSWMHPGTGERGVTWTVGDKDDAASIAGWVATRVAKERDFVAPKLDALLSCEREVTSDLGAIRISINNWKVRFEDGRLVASFPIFDLNLRLSPPAQEPKIDGLTPLVAKGEPVEEKKTRMLRDVREPEYVRLISEAKWTFAGQAVSLSLVSSDGKTGLVTLAAYDQAAKKERTVGIYLEDFYSGSWCQVTKAPE